MTNQANESGTQGSASTNARQGTTGQVREKVEQAFGSARDKTVSAYSASRDRASQAAQRTAQSIDGHPVAALVGGLALGAIAGALLPASRKESELLAPLGGKVGDAAKSAALAAREAGKNKLGEIGLDRDSAREQVSKLVENALKVAGEAGTAAARAVREGGTTQA